MDERGAYLKGFLTGDGTYVRTAKPPRVDLTLHPSKHICFERLRNSYVELLQPIWTKYTRGRKIKYTVLIKGHTQSNGCFYLLGLNAVRKELVPYVSIYREEFPINWKKWSNKSRVEYIAGAFDSDGTIQVKGVCGDRFIYTISSVRRVWLSGLQIALKKMGIDSNLILQRKARWVDMPEGRKSFSKDLFMLYTYTYDSKKISKTFNFSRLRNWNQRTDFDFNS